VLNIYLTSFLYMLCSITLRNQWWFCWLNLTETLPPICMLTTHSAPCLTYSVTTTEPHGRLVIPVSPPPGRPWPSFLKNALGALGYLVLFTEAALKVYFPHVCMPFNDAFVRWSCYSNFLSATKLKMATYNNNNNNNYYYCYSLQMGLYPVAVALQYTKKKHKITHTLETINNT
jgi:hypothetical protein